MVAFFGNNIAHYHTIPAIAESFQNVFVEPNRRVLHIDRGPGDFLESLRALQRIGCQRVTLAAMGLDPEDAPPAGDPVVIDAMVGYSADGPLRGRAAQLAGWSAGREVVALDLPSGVDADAGPTAGSVTATVTVTLALPKPGLAAPGGDLVLADLGLPAGLWGGLVEAVPPDLFADGHLVPLTATSSGFSATSS